MLAFYILLIQLFVAPCTYALGILLPLYVYPGTNCAAWSPVFDAISANSNTQWYIVINPNDGPGSTSDQLYQDCVSRIPSSSNQIIMGFINTNRGNTLGDVDAYAGWPSSSRPRGIFFVNITPTTGQLATYQSYISHAKSQGFTFMGLDPGQSVSDSAYFSAADLVNTYEDSYSSFNPNSLSGTMSKQSVILVNSPSTGSYSSVISQLQSKGVAAVYISTVSDDRSDLPAQLSLFASEVASVGGAIRDPPRTPLLRTQTRPTPAAPSNPSNGSPNSGSATAGSPPSIPGGPASTTSNSSPSSQNLKSPSQSNGVKGASCFAAVDTRTWTETNKYLKPQAAASASHHGPSIAAIVGGVLGGLIVLLLLLVGFLCMRRRRRNPLGSPETVAPFTEVQQHTPTLITAIAGASTLPAQTEDTEFASGSSTTSWNRDVKPPVPESDISATTAAEPSTHRASHLTAARISAAPTYGSAWETFSGTSGPPPSYHN
ncbi:Spherulation-specific family 4-domain-containing protein [Favolaschia claudopus]|uniref:Spherulation-specific family 4-domain-containing protein n=1 Tax=Favolaschia claudopus TaxID=2862362 RepID=A0AAW0CA97_9AGAR